MGGEDLFAEKCLEKNGAMKIEAFDIKVDGACPANRPKDQAKNKKWKPNCAQTVTPAMHPFKKTAEWVKCYKESSAAEVTTVQDRCLIGWLGSSGRNGWQRSCRFGIFEHSAMMPIIFFWKQRVVQAHRFTVCRLDATPDYVFWRLHERRK